MVGLARDRNSARQPLRRRIESRAIKHLAPYLAGRNAGKRKLVDAEKRLRRLFMAEFQRVLPMPAQQPQGFDPLRAAGEVPYELVDGVGIIWRKKLMGGGEMPTLLTNFTAKITATVFRTDGVDRACEFEIEAAMRGKPPRRFTVKQKEFEEMSWPGRELGAEAGVEPENGFDRRTAAAIRKLSGEIVQRVLYTHTGWMKLDDVGYVYLHAGGIISAVDSPPSIQVALDSGVANYLLPPAPQGEELRDRDTREPANARARAGSRRLSAVLSGVAIDPSTLEVHGARRRAHRHVQERTDCAMSAAFRRGDGRNESSWSMAIDGQRPGRDALPGQGRALHDRRLQAQGLAEGSAGVSRQGRRRHPRHGQRHGQTAHAR
jgi:hypothetical protein